MYLAEEAVLDWFRSQHLGPAKLFHEYGLALSIVDSSVQLPAVLDLDDIVDAEVTGGPDRFGVRLRARRPGNPTVLRGKMTVALVPTTPADTPLPASLASAIGDLASAGLPGRTDLDNATGADPERLLADSGAFVWSWRVPYYYCQYSTHIQHGGYVRAVEEAVDRFLADRGLSVRTMLERRGWIPVVSRARVTQFVAADMEETVHTAFRVTEVVRGTGFDATVDCYVSRGGTLVHTATAKILHGYAISRGPQAGRLAELDAATVAALTRVPATQGSRS
jgi:acyl-CoA thioesterase FadM